MYRICLPLRHGVSIASLSLFLYISHDKVLILSRHAFTYKHTDWLKTLPPETARALAGIVMQFARAGTEGLESPQIFQTPDVAQAGGLTALKAIGDAAEVLSETKKRIFAS